MSGTGPKTQHVYDFAELIICVNTGCNKNSLGGKKKKLSADPHTATGGLIQIKGKENSAGMTTLFLIQYCYYPKT
jgi:hypothetical protein